MTHTMKYLTAFLVCKQSENNLLLFKAPQRNVAALC